MADAPFTAVVATLFPDAFPGPLGVSLLGRALREDIWRLKTLDFRDFASDKHRSVDDAPFGGGPGLVMRPDIAAAAIDAGRDLLGAGAPAIYLSSRGRPFDQTRARALAAGPGVLLLCGRFEGLDDRVIAARDVEEVCVGDAVLTGGEIPAMAVLDATVRLLDGVLGAADSLVEESFADGLLEHPQYTRPAVWEGRAAPEVLLSGDHAKVGSWRRREAERVTRERRPDLWRAYRARQEHGDVEAASHEDEAADAPRIE